MRYYMEDRAWIPHALRALNTPSIRPYAQRFLDASPEERIVLADKWLPRLDQLIEQKKQEKKAARKKRANPPSQTLRLHSAAPKDSISSGSSAQVVGAQATDGEKVTKAAKKSGAKKK